MSTSYLVVIIHREGLPGLTFIMQEPEDHRNGKTAHEFDDGVSMGAKSRRSESKFYIVQLSHDHLRGYGYSTRRWGSENPEFTGVFIASLVWVDVGI